MSKYVLGLLTFFICLEPAVFADDDEWQGFSYEEAGITTAEYEMVREKGMSRKELLKLLEYGVMPQEYFSEPWKKLGVSKTEWIMAKKQGMEDMDIDRRVYTRSYVNYDLIVSFFLPGFYAYKTKRYKYGGAMTGVFLISTILTFTHKRETARDTQHPEKHIIIAYPIIAFCSMVWSASDAFIKTRYRDNRDASRFSLNIIPSTSPSVTFSYSF
ncbi:hypothetical protein ACFL5V_03615 [Fibrobacterota bacterium]